MAVQERKDTAFDISSPREAGYTTTDTLESKYRIKSISNEDNDSSMSSSKHSSISDGNRSTNCLMASKFYHENKDKVPGKSLFDMSFDIEDVVKTVFHPKVGKSIATYVKNILDTNKHPNFVVVVRKNAFKCHWEVLTTYSSFFNEEMCKKQTVDLGKSVTAVGFDMAYQWMLAEKPVLQRDCLVDLFQTAVVLEIQLLLQHCWDLFGSGIYFLEDRAFAVFLECQRFGKELFDLRNQMLVCVSKIFLPVVATIDFLNLSIEDLKVLLSSNSLAVNSEMEVLYAGARWLLYKWSEREKFAMDIMSCIRFKLLSPLILSTFSHSNHLPFIRSIATTESFQSLIRDAIQYSSILAIHGSDSMETTELLQACDLKKPSHRKWLHDFDCSHHHSQNCVHNGNFSMESFMKYCDFIGKAGVDYWNTVIEPDRLGLKKTCCINAQKHSIKH